MDESSQPGLKIGQVFLAQAQFEHREDALTVSPKTAVELSIEIGVQTRVTDDGKRGVIVLSAATDSDDQLYRFRVEMAGLVSADESSPNLEVRDYLAQQASAMMFPFLREAVASITGRGRFGPIVINPINLTQPDKVTKLDGGDGPETSGAI
jgi:preprotein translocase subunit SecB